MLPRSRDGADLPETTYADTGVETLTRRLESGGVARENLDAKLVGGSRMPELSDGVDRIGARNVRVARQVLGALGVSVVATRVGGDHG
jgi:chemotaxis receptor (MCP) glutamine deamidase CheD